MISHLTPERRVIDSRLVGTITSPSRREGEFKYWPHVYELWVERKYGARIAGQINFGALCFVTRPSDYEMSTNCGRRQ
jgi:hypothetical protein